MALFCLFVRLFVRLFVCLFVCFFFFFRGEAWYFGGVWECDVVFWLMVVVRSGISIVVYTRCGVWAVSVRTVRW